ncbi:MAG: sulfatase-like hydrolase/transferase, partial [Planctomycetota bacterium]|nr:sulfatase-like hydrolase/transferase [Planctomycetota bacterium]
MMHQHSFSSVTLALLLALSAVAQPLKPLRVACLGDSITAGARVDAKQPNVLFLFSDDQRFDTIAALGNPWVKTPNLDRLVERGFVFRHTYCMGSTNAAVCLPSRAMVHSGQSLWKVARNLKVTNRTNWAEEARVYSLEGVTTWAETMREGGYSTFGTGKWHNGKKSFARGFTDGGAIFFGGMSDHLKVPIFDFDPSGQYPKKNRRLGKKFSSELFADAAVEFLNARAADKADGRPFFMYVAFSAPHDPRMAPKEFVDMYDADKLPLAKSVMPRHPFDNGELKIRDECLAPWPRTPKIVRRHLADYYAMITHMDHHIGRILDALKKSGQAENTIIVFSSDHGLSVGRHGLLGKQNLYEHGMRPPLIVSGPGIPKGESEALVYLHDLFPTVCDLVGLKTPTGVEGKSLAPVMRGETSKVRDYVIGAYRNFQRMVREPRWKLITYDVKGLKTSQLFDLENDPLEMNNLVSNSDCQ